jgi:hypothetical protein
MPKWTFRVAILVIVVLTASGCGWVKGVFGSSDTTGPQTSAVNVLDVQIGQCFNPPAEVKAELSSLTALPCDQPHSQEAYALLDYVPPNGVTVAGYPGTDALDKFAQGACAQAFQGYDGISYLDSTLFFTYLLPSARGWEQGPDKKILCLIMTTGAPLTSSVKGKKL